MSCGLLNLGQCSGRDQLPVLFNCLNLQLFFFILILVYAILVLWHFFIGDSEDCNIDVCLMSLTFFVANFAKSFTSPRIIFAPSFLSV